MTTATARKPVPSTRQPGVLLYSRLSNRPGESKVMTVAEQERINEAHVERLGIPGGVIGRFADNGVSAFKRVKRDDYADLLATIERGVGTHVAIVAIDRASRRVGDVAALLDICERNGVLLAVDGKVLDPADDALGMYLSAIVGESESREKSKRVLRAKQVSLANCTYAGGHRPFGFKKRPDAAAGWWDQDPEEAKAICEGYKLVMDGGALHDVSRLWNERGIRTSSAGNVWTFSSARNALTSPIVAGLRTTNGGEVVGPLRLPDGSLWPAILTPEQRDDVLRVIRSRYSARERWHTPAPALLSGIITCGRCGHRMNIQRYLKPGAPKPSYACNGDGGDRCGRMAISAHRAEADVVAWAIELLGSAKLRKALAKPKTKRTGPDPAKIQEEIDLLGEAKDNDQITMRDYLRRYQPLQAKLQAALAVEDDDDRSRVLGPFIDDPASFLDTDLERQRAILATLFDRVEVGPAIGNQYSSARLTPFERG